MSDILEISEKSLDSSFVGSLKGTEYSTHTPFIFHWEGIGRDCLVGQRQTQSHGSQNGFQRKNVQISGSGTRRLLFFFLAVCGKFVAFFRMLIGAKMAIPYILVSFVASYGLILCIRHTIVPVDKVFWVKLKKLEGKGKGFRVGPCTSAAVQKSQQTRGNGLDAGSVLHCNLYNGVVVKYEFIDILFLFSGRHQENVKLLKFHLISLNLFNSKFMRIRKWIEVASYLIFF